MLECKGLIIRHPSTHTKPFIQANRKGEREREDFKGPCSTRIHCGGSGHSQDFLYNKKTKAYTVCNIIRLNLCNLDQEPASYTLI